MAHLKRELFIILAALFSLVIIWVFLYSPKLKELNTARDVLARLQQDMDISISAVEKIPLLKKQIEELNSNVVRLQLKQRLEEQKTESDIIETLTGNLNKGMELISIRTIDSEEKWFGFDIGLKCKRFSALGRYMESLNKAPLILKTKHIVIKKMEADALNHQLEVQLTVDAYKGKL